MEFRFAILKEADQLLNNSLVVSQEFPNETKVASF